MVMYIYPILWLLLALIGIKKNESDIKEPFSKKQSLAVRGIAAIEIMLGHIGIYTNSSALLVFRKSGIFFVGIFFALSGYANALNLSEKEEYNKKYLSKRFFHLIIPAYIAFLFGLIENSYMARDYRYMIGLIKPDVIFDGINWFVWELLLMYIVTYIVYIISKNKKSGGNDGFKKSAVIVIIASVIFVSLAYFVADETWYGSTLCYSLGMLLYFYKDEIIQKLINNKIISCVFIILAMIGFAAVFYLTGEESFIGNVICRNMLSLGFSVLIFRALIVFNVGNKVSRFLGEISFEVYLFHNMFLGFIGFFIKEPVLLCFLVVLSTILFSKLYRVVINSISSKLMKNK